MVQPIPRFLFLRDDEALRQQGRSNFKNMKAAIEEQDFAKAAVEMMDSRWASQTPERAERLKLRVERLAGK